MNTASERTARQALASRMEARFSALTKSNVGLGNVDNTADTAKPVSTAQQAALDVKLDSNNLLDTALVQFGALMVPVAYNSGWPTLDSGLTANAAVGWHFIGGPSTSPPPSVTGPAVWDATS